MWVTLALDLHSLRGIEISLADGEDARFLAVDQAPPLAADVLVIALRQLLQVAEVSLRKDGRLVRLGDEVEVLLQLADLAGHLGIDARRERLVAVASMLQQVVDLAPVGVVLHALHHVLETAPDGVELHRVELLLFDQHLLAHPDLPKSWSSEA